MNIGIIGINKVSEFYAMIFSQYGHNVIMYDYTSIINNFAIEKMIFEKGFFEKYIKSLSIFKELIYEESDFEIGENFLFKEVNINEKFIKLKSFEYIEDFNFYKIPNLEIVQLKLESINQIKMMEDILILDTPDKNLLNQIDLIRFNNWISIYIKVKDNKSEFQITKENSYSISGINDKDDKESMDIFINCQKRRKKEVLKIISKKFKNYEILDEQEIPKYNKYAYKNIAIINTALLEYNYPYRDYSLLFQIIETSTEQKVFSSLDIYSDIKSKVI